MKKAATLNYIEKAIIVFFGLSVFTSKAGLNISVVMLLLYFLFSCITNRDYRSQVVHNNIFKLSITLYVIGLFSTLIYPTTSPDTIYFARKAAFLLAIPCLFMLNMKQENKELAIKSLLVSFMIAALFAIYHALSLDNWTGERITGFLDVGRWSEILTYFLVFMLPLVLNSKEKKQKRILYVCLMILGYICLLLSGSRGGMLVTFGVSLLYLMFYNRAVFYRLVVISLIALPLIIAISPSKANIIQDRITSITNTTSNESNSARLKMWQSGFLFAVDNLANNPRAFFFGTGQLNFEKEYTSFIKNSEGNILVHYPQFSFSDSHNGVIDASLKLGIIYEIIFLSLIFLIGIKILHATPSLRDSGVSVIIAFFSIGLFYTNQMEYQTICFFYFLSITFPHRPEHKNA